MSTAELEIKKAQLVRKILNEKDENIIISIGKNLHRIKRAAMNTEKKEKLVNEFLQFVETNSITDLNFKFNREDCYDRKIFLR